MSDFVLRIEMTVKLLLFFGLAFSACVSNRKLPFPESNGEPEYPGGLAAMFKFVGAHFAYPQQAVKARIDPGKIIVSFTVNEIGALQNITLKQDPGYGFVEELTRVLESMPKWKPAMKNGRPYKSVYSFPIHICLE